MLVSVPTYGRDHPAVFDTDAIRLNIQGDQRVALLVENSLAVTYTLFRSRQQG